MAITGATATPITPAYGRCRVIPVPEHSVQTFPVGAPVFRSAGYATVVTGNLPQTILGFAVAAGQNGASDGAKTARLYMAEDGVAFQGTLVGTLAQANRGAKALISVDSAGSAFLTIATASSASYNAKIEGWTSDWTTGDVNPVVTFTVLSSKLDSVN